MRNSHLGRLRFFCVIDLPSGRFFCGENMSERLIHPDSKTVAGITAKRLAGGTFERYATIDQKETRRQFIAGMGPQELVIENGGRNEYMFRHKKGFTESKLKIVSIGAHPDDTALSEGLEYLLLQHTRQEMNDVGLAVITATDGQWGGHPHLTPQELGVERINEDVNGTALLGADVYFNLGFSDGNIADNYGTLTQRLAVFLEELDADIVILPDPEDLVHKDHIDLATAAQAALRKNRQNPIVGYSDFQNGDRVIGEESIQFALNAEEYQIFQDAYLIHQTQTRRMTPDVLQVLSRPIERARQSTFAVPYVGVTRQNMDFSLVPLEKYLGSRVLKQPKEELVFAYR